MNNTQAATQVVRSLFQAVENNDREQVLEHFAEDGVFHNIPMEPAQGHEAIWQAFAPIHDICGGIEWLVHNICETNDGKVMTERTDRYQINDKWCEFRVMGIFEIVDGKVQHWRDYFDLNQVMEQLA